MDLADRDCQPCRGGVPPLSPEEIAPLAERLPRWTVVEHHHLERELSLPDFRSALALVVAVGAEAEAANHHPDLRLGWGHVGLTLYTHAIDGLQEADFILAARIERLIEALPE
jgi:4a-hydroxytetrahydrobiopterin dehydratase